MSSFDPMAAAIDWLDAYRSASLSIVDMYHPDASLECGCIGQTTLIGKQALLEYWRHRFSKRPAGDLRKLSANNDQVFLSYLIPGSKVQAILNFNAEGQIVRSECRPVIGLQRRYDKSLRRRCKRRLTW